MPKLKTNKGVAKRVKVTGRGKILRHQGGKSHLLSNKSGKRRRHLRRPKVAAAGQAKQCLRALAGWKG